MNKVYVLGGTQTDFERNWTKENKNIIALLKEITSDGLKAVNVTFEDIRELNKNNRIACFVGNFLAEHYINQSHLGALLTEVDSAFFGVPSARYEAACASGSVALDAAITKIQNDDYDMAIVIGLELMKTVDGKTGSDFLGQAAYYEKEAKDIEFSFPKLFSKLADEILIKYKLDERRFMDSLAMISVKNYSNAKRNSFAQTRKWFMNYEQARKRGTPTNSFIGGRLAVSDCSQVTDGAAIVVLVSENYIKYRRLKCPIIKGYGHRVAPMIFEKKMDDSKSSNYILPWTRCAVLDAYRRSNLTINDIDFFETHDCFTSSEYMAISAFGITEPGEEYTAIEDGITAFNGDKPINASGGLIGCGHPVGASGVRMFLDLYKQISGQAGKYQLNKVNNGMMLNIGGSATTNYSFIVGKEV